MMPKKKNIQNIQTIERNIFWKQHFLETTFLRFTLKKNSTKKKFHTPRTTSDPVAASSTTNAKPNATDNPNKDDCTKDNCVSIHTCPEEVITPFVKAPLVAVVSNTFCKSVRSWIFRLTLACQECVNTTTMRESTIVLNVSVSYRTVFNARCLGPKLMVRTMSFFSRSVWVLGFIFIRTGSGIGCTGAAEKHRVKRVSLAGYIHASQSSQTLKK